MEFKTPKVFFVMVVCLVVLITSRTSYAFNLTHILDEYISVCGSQICNIEKHSINYLNLIHITYKIHCPKCSCQVGCVQDGNCCPDLFFSLKLTCVKTSIVESPYWYSPYKVVKSKLNAHNCPPVLMVNSCPKDATTIQKSLCNVSDLQDQQIENIPVSSNKTGLIYRNIHCLKCHKESVEDLILWSLNLECEYDRFEDFNYLASYNDIIEKAKNENCSIAFEPNDKISKRKCVPDSKTTALDKISSCNISGTWQNYDHDIDVACQSYDHAYFSFKNVFCYLCNPPSDTGDLISTCNTTGVWEQYNDNLQIACEKEKSSVITGKFKNIFCYLCNKNNSVEGNFPTFYGADVKVDYLDYIGSNEPFEYRFKVKSVNIRSIFGQEDLKKSTVTSKTHLISLSDSENVTEHYRSSLKTTNLMKKYFALTGKTSFCTNYSLFNSIQDCNCDDYCAVRFYSEWGHGRCCVDSFIGKKSICTDQTYHEDNRFLLYEGCEKFGNSTIQNLCQTKKQKTFHNDLISFLPAQIMIKNSLIDFKNIYCAFCNTNQEVIRNYENEIVLWGFKLRCKVFIPIFYHFSVQDIIAFALNNRCRFIYIPTSSARVCSKNTYTTCNMTGNWNLFDPDIVSACNDYKLPYGTENEFCYMCNPSVRENILYYSCNQTGEWDEYDMSIEENCLNMPAVEYYSPYKNIFCGECNGRHFFIEDMPRNQSTSSLNGYIWHSNEKIFIPRFQSIFKFTDYKIASAESDIEGNCLQNQIYNPLEKICIDLKCYPGRILTEEGCKPLLEMTKDIGYMLSLELNGKFNTEIVDVISFLHDVNISLRIAMLNKDWYRWTSRKSILICQNRIFLNSTNISLLVNMNISYLNYVNRTSVEDSFLSFTKFSLPVHYFNTTFNLSVLLNEGMYLLSTLESQSKFTNTCITTDDNHNYLKRYSHVKRLLLCKQVELPEYDTEIENETFRLTIKSLGVKLDIMDYEIIPTFKVRICADQFESLIFLKRTELDKPITYQNFIGFILMACTCISLICLLFTFFTFLAYKSLRTLPGKNNMCLIFAMFCAQLLYQFGLNQTDSIIICQIIGVCIHYFWLATFGCISICSFHMYRVFKRTILHSDTFKEKTVLFYVLYSYCIPFIIVSTNVGVTYILENNIGYGGHICFLNQPIGLIVTFISPIIFICLSNIFFFVVTTRTIHRTTVVAKEQHINNNRSQFIIYVKLFTVTGIGWLLQVVDSYLPDTSNEAKIIFSTIISLMNSLQGLFIFISYVCNRRVLLLYKKGNILGTSCKFTRRSKSYALEGSSLHTMSSTL